MLTKAAFLNGRRRKPRTALFVLQCRGIYSSSFDPVLTSASSPGFFCRPVLNRQNRFRLHLNEWSWMDGGRGRRKVKSWKYSAEVVVPLLLGKGGGREKEKGASRTRVLHMYLPFHLSLLSAAAEGWTDHDVDSGKVTFFLGFGDDVN